MRWQNKAKIMKISSMLPAKVYRLFQKSFGHLNADPMKRMPAQVEMAKWILNSGNVIRDKRFFEVGTGHIPIAPVGFFLCGAGSVLTVDLHRRIEWRLTRESLVRIAACRDEVFSMYRHVVDESVFNERFGLLFRHQHDPAAFFKEAGIEYLAPRDAAHTRLPDYSVDYHFSITTLEHIPLPVIRDIFLEAKRIMSQDSVAIHFIDLSDHFQHQDTSISKINFLRYSEKEWQRIASNEFTYCNRLRSSDYQSLFLEMGLKTLRQEKNIDKESLDIINKGFLLDKYFSNYTKEDICSVSLRILLTH